MRRPNVLFIWTDQQRWDALGAAGVRDVRTPNLDRLAAAGTRFPRTFANCPVCMPSRQSVLSGRYPATLGVRTNGIEMPDTTPCLQHVLRAHGYHTAQLGKLHFLNHASPFRDHSLPHPSYGFDRCTVSDEPGCYDDPYIAWVGARDPEAVDSCRVDTPPAWTGVPISVHPRNVHQPYGFEGPEELTHSAWVSEITCDYIHSRAASARSGEPFFAVSGFYAPHAPLNPPRRFIDMYDPADMPLPARAGGENFHDPETGEPVSDDQWRKVVQHYYALVSHVDECVGRIIAVLEEESLLDDTMIIFTSDHGENLGDHGLVQKTQWYDSSTRVPLIVKPPAAEVAADGRGRDAGSPHARSASRGLVSESIVELVDLAPTVADYCEIPVPSFFQGRSLRSVIEGEGAGRSSAFMEYGAPDRADSWKGVRTGEFLYARRRDGGEHLYDLHADPDQTRDLCAPNLTPPAGLLRTARDELLGRLIDTDTCDSPRTGMY